MKIPKFMKNSTHLSRQQSLARSNRQLQLTDNLYRIQPQKAVQVNTSAAFSAFKDIINTVPSIAETTENCQKAIAAAAAATASPAFVKPQPPSIAPPPTPSQSSQISSLFQIKSFSVKSSVESHLNASILQVSVSGQNKSHSKTKRLQRNRIQVSSKPSNYALRSTTAAQSAVYHDIQSPARRTPRASALPFKALGRKIAESPANYEFDFVDCAVTAKENTPVPVKVQVAMFEKKQPEAPLVAKPTPNRIKLEPIQQSHTPSGQLSNIAKKIQQQQEKQEATPSSNRFSFSKLTKFVSQSAMRVMSRRSAGGGSNGSSPDTTASFSSTSMLTDDDNDDSRLNDPKQDPNENFYFACEPSPKVTLQQLQPQQQQQQPPKQPGFNDCIYKSFEQYKGIEQKINKSCLSHMRSNASASREKPTMGVTSIMIKQYKKSNQTSSSAGNNFSTVSMYQYAMTAGLGTSSACLIGAPVVINTESFKQQQSSFASSNMSCNSNHSSASSQSSVYDRLNQNPPPPTPFIDLKPLSSKKSFTPAKVFNSEPKFVAKQVEQELLYETFNESRF
jgi:hypothetical protein